MKYPKTMQINIDKKTGTFLGVILVLVLAELSTAKGSAFDRLFLQGMIAHHEGAIDMLSMIKNSTNSEVKKLYNDILTSQSAEIEAMKALLK